MKPINCLGLNQQLKCSKFAFPRDTVSLMLIKGEDQRRNMGEGGPTVRLSTLKAYCHHMCQYTVDTN